MGWILSALIGVVIVLLVTGAVVRRGQSAGQPQTNT